MKTIIRYIPRKSKHKTVIYQLYYPSYEFLLINNSSNYFVRLKKQALIFFVFIKLQNSIKNNG